MRNRYIKRTHERPILFSGQMVTAIFEELKTQTRRIIKPQPVNQLHYCGGTAPNGDVYVYDWVEESGGCEGLRRCPYGMAGDRLWVRETWAPAEPGPLREGMPIAYRVDFPADDGVNRQWRPSIHMPRWASRINLEITDIRVERLQDISADDAEAEGLYRGKARRHLFWPFPGACRLIDGLPHKAVFADLWEAINGSGSWADNPWVWVIQFQRLCPGE